MLQKLLEILAGFKNDEDWSLDGLVLDFSIQASGCDVEEGIVRLCSEDQQKMWRKVLRSVTRATREEALIAAANCVESTKRASMVLGGRRLLQGTTCASSEFQEFLDTVLKGERNRHIVERNLSSDLYRVDESLAAVVVEGKQA